MKRIVALLIVLAMVLLPACRKEDRWQEQYELGRKYLSDGDYEEAILAFTLAIEIDPEQPKAYLYRGDAYLMAARDAMENGDYDDAEDYLDKAYDDYDRAEDLDYDEDKINDRREELEELEEEIKIQDVGPGGIRPEDESVREEIKAAYRDYFYSRYDDADYVVLADVTGDGMDEMLVADWVDPDGFEIVGHVYTMMDGEVTEVYTNRGSTVHAGGFYGWYLVERDGGYCLGEEGFGMWQGMGILSFTQYTFDERWEKQELEYLSVNSEDEGNHDEYGMITEEAYSGYLEQLNEIMARSYCICATASEGYGSMWIETFPPAVFETMDDAPPAMDLEEVAYVEDAYVEVFQNPFNEDYEYCFHIPQFVLSDDRCAVMNEQIYQDLSRIMSEYTFDYGEFVGQPSVSTYYAAGQANGIASVVSEVVFQSSDYWYFRTYNMNIATGWEATDQEVIAAFGYTEEEFRDMVRQMLEVRFPLMFEGILEYLSQNEYDWCLEQTLSDENVYLARPCIDENGRLCVVVTIYGFAGAGAYDYRICLEEPDNTSNYWIYCPQHG